MSTLSLLAALASLAALAPPPTVAPVPPAEAVPAGPPTWCSAKPAPESYEATKPSLSTDVYGGLTLESMEELARFGCNHTDDAQRQAWVQAIRQSISNDYGLTLADNERLMKLLGTLYTADSSYRRPNSHDTDPGCQKLPPLKSGPFAARFSRTLERVAIGCGEWRSIENQTLPSRYGNDAPPFWVVDSEGGLGSELAKGAAISIILSDLTGKNETERSDLRLYAQWVNASAIEPDPSRFYDELKALALPEVTAVQAILNYRRALVRLDQQRAFIEAAAKQSKGLEAYFLSGPQAARKRLATEAAGGAKLLAEVAEVERKRIEDPEALKGCAKALFATFEPWVRGALKAQPKATPQDFVMDGLVGSQLAWGLTLCALGDTTAPVMDQVFGYYFYRSPTLRGPISASQAGSIEGYNEAMSHKAGGAWALSLDGGSAVEPLRPIVNPPSLGMSVHASYLPYDPQQMPSGIVASVKTAGADTTLTFKAVTFKEPQLKCEDSDQLWRITPSGTRIYHHICKKTGERTVTRAPKPITVPTWAAGGIKANALVSFWRYDNGEAPERGWVVEAFADKSGKKRVNFLGAKL